MGLEVVRVRFPGEAVVCTGPQIAMVLGSIANAMAPAIWYLADVRAVGESLGRSRTPVPERVGTAAAMLEQVQSVGQFESGVFVAVPAAIEEPRFREGGLYTEDPVDVELGDSVVEVRAFDTSFIEIISSDRTILEEVSRTFAASIEPALASA